MNIETKTDFFLDQINLHDQRSETKNKIIEFFAMEVKHPLHILYRNASLYFFINDTQHQVEALKITINNDDLIRFNGEKVSRIDPEYYVGPLHRKQGDSFGHGVSFNFSTNNNNNNNNNGNNNG